MACVERENMRRLRVRVRRARARPAAARPRRARAAVLDPDFLRPGTPRRTRVQCVPMEAWSGLSTLVPRLTRVTAHRSQDSREGCPDFATLSVAHLAAGGAGPRGQWPVPAVMCRSIHTSTTPQNAFCVFESPHLYSRRVNYRCTMYQHVSFDAPSGLASRFDFRLAFRGLWSVDFWCRDGTRRSLRVARSRCVQWDPPCGARLSGRSASDYMDTGGFSTGSGTNLNSLNASPDDQSRAHHTAAVAAALRGVPL